MCVCAFNIYILKGKKSAQTRRVSPELGHKQDNLILEPVRKEGGKKSQQIKTVNSPLCHTTHNAAGLIFFFSLHSGQTGYLQNKKNT